MGNAVLRNKFKRRCRNLFNKFNKDQLSNCTIIIKPQKPLLNNYSWNELSRSFEQFCIKLDI